MKDDRTVTQWSIRFPNGSTNGIWGDRTRVMQEAKIADHTLAVAGSVEHVEIITRTQTITYTEWEPES
jgi:hypothetical protein